MASYGIISWAWQGLFQINLPTSKQLAASVQNVTRVLTGFASFVSSASFSPLDGWKRLDQKCKTITHGDLAWYKTDLKHIQCHERWKMLVVSLDWIPSSTRVGPWELQYKPFWGALLCSHSGASRKMFRTFETFGLICCRGLEWFALPQVFHNTKSTEMNSNLHPFVTKQFAKA